MTTVLTVKIHVFAVRHLMQIDPHSFHSPIHLDLLVHMCMLQLASLCAEVYFYVYTQPTTPRSNEKNARLKHKKSMNQTKSVYCCEYGLPRICDLLLVILNRRNLVLPCRMMFVVHPKWSFVCVMSTGNLRSIPESLMAIRSMSIRELVYSTVCRTPTTSRLYFPRDDREVWYPLWRRT